MPDENERLNLADTLQEFYDHADEASGGRLGILRNTIQNFNQARSAQMAAAIAYYALFSLFPLLIVLIVVASFVLDRAQAQQQVLLAVGEILPAPIDLIRSNIQTVFELRGEVGLVGLATLLWSALGAFSTLAHSINRAWPQTPKRNFLQQRLVGLLMVITLVGLLALSLASTAAMQVLSGLNVPLLGRVDIYETELWTVASRLFPLLISLVMFLSLYRWTPNTDVPWSAALGAGLIAAIAWQGVAAGFAWYLRSGLARYELVFGSLGALVALMFWLYLSALIALFGAHLSAAIAQGSRPKAAKNA